MGECVVVLGMHRSGTSALTGALERSGVYLGSSYIADLFEHEFSVNLNSLLLADLGSSWDDVFMLPGNWWHKSVAGGHQQRLVTALEAEFGAKRLWGLKDPRLCITLPLWLDAFSQLGVKPYFIIALRHPGEICKSHELRDGFSHSKTMMIWMNYLLTAERCTRNFNRCFTMYEDLLENPRGCLQDIQQKLNLHLPRPWAEAENDILEFIDPGLKHHNAVPTDLSAGTPEFASEFWKLLENLLHAESDRGTILKSIDAIDAKYRSLHSFFLNSQVESDTKSRRAQLSKAMNILNDIGQDHLVRGRLDHAVQFFRQMVKDFPGDLRMHNNLGIAHELKGNLHTARDCFNTALEIEPLYALARQNLERLKSC